MFEWRDPSFDDENMEHNDRESMRPSEAFRDFGGLRIGESNAQLLRRTSAISAIRERLAKGQANASDIDALDDLLGIEDEDEDPFGLMEDDD